MTIDWTKFLGVVELNPTELCNLQCEFCPRAHGYPNQNLHLRPGLVEIVKDYLIEMDYRGIVCLSGKGEPTLAKHFREICEIILDNPWKTKINTNGKNFDEYIDLIERFDIVHYDYYDEDWEGFLETVEKYKKYPNIKFWYKPPIDWNQYTQSYTNRAGSIEGDFKFDTRNKPYQKYCGRPTRKLFIDWNGDYRLCCEDWRKANKYSKESDYDMYMLENDPEICFGNVLEQSIEEYLNTNKQLAKYRDNLLRGDRSLSPCNTCSFRNDDDHEHFLRVLDEYQQYNVQPSHNHEGSNSIPLRTIE